ncbi:hypothetical protein EU527_07600 [Candidatus Thorarchaeota archaeon]|nr:MAG: hypothetical protein EU527_07600 [Candidatus Thorarchaeota archaeon]
MENDLLKEARALYKDRLKIAMSALIFVFFFAFSFFFNPVYLGPVPTGGIPSGWTQGIAVVISLNSIGFYISALMILLIYRFWSWAFLPGPASTYTYSILQGILGNTVTIKHSIGKRFKVTLENGLQFDLSCKIQDKPSGEWFIYRLVSSKFKNNHLRDIALRHGFGVKDNRFVANVSNDELHHRTFLLAKAMTIASSVYD